MKLKNVMMVLLVLGDVYVHAFSSGGEPAPQLNPVAKTVADLGTYLGYESQGRLKPALKPNELTQFQRKAIAARDAIDQKFSQPVATRLGYQGNRNVGFIDMLAGTSGRTLKENGDVQPVNKNEYYQEQYSVLEKNKYVEPVIIIENSSNNVDQSQNQNSVTNGEPKIAFNNNQNNSKQLPPDNAGDGIKDQLTTKVVSEDQKLNNVIPVENKNQNLLNEITNKKNVEQGEKIEQNNQSSKLVLDSRYEKYIKMKKMGTLEGAVGNKMQMDGFKPEEIDNFFKKIIPFKGEISFVKSEGNESQSVKFFDASSLKNNQQKFVENKTEDVSDYLFTGNDALQKELNKSYQEQEKARNQMKNSIVQENQVLIDQLLLDYRDNYIQKYTYIFGGRDDFYDKVDRAVEVEQQRIIDEILSQPKSVQRIEDAAKQAKQIFRDKVKKAEGENKEKVSKVNSNKDLNLIKKRNEAQKAAAEKKKRDEAENKKRDEIKKSVEKDFADNKYKKWLDLYTFENPDYNQKQIEEAKTVKIKELVDKAFKDRGADISEAGIKAVDEFNKKNNNSSVLNNENKIAQLQQMSIKNQIHF